MSHASHIAPLYDHERDDAAGGRRRRTTNDWGADDLFDGARPARRPTRAVRGDGRADRRVAHDDRPRPHVTAPARRASAPWSSPAAASAAGESDSRAAAPGRPAAPPAGRAVPRPNVEPDGFELRAGEPRAVAARAAAPAQRRAVADWFADDESRRAGDDWLTARDESAASVGAVDLDTRAGEPIRSAAEPAAPATAVADESVATRELDLPLGAVRPARRTVTVTGHPDAVRRAARAGELARRRPAPSLEARLSHRPDRVAMYACALGLLLVLVAIATAQL